jgi:hypothetical protein
MWLDEINEACVLLVWDVIDDWDFGSPANHTKHPSALWPLIWKKPKTLSTDLGLINLNWSRKNQIGSNLFREISSA